MPKLEGGAGDGGGSTTKNRGQNPTRPPLERNVTCQRHVFWLRKVSSQVTWTYSQNPFKQIQAA